MKKTKLITLAIVCAALSSCHKNNKEADRLNMRSDTTAAYTHTHNYFLWWYAFRPYGVYSHGAYTRTGFYSKSIAKTSNIGHSTMKGSMARGGFGGRGAVSSSRGGGFSSGT